MNNNKLYKIIGMFPFFVGVLIFLLSAIAPYLNFNNSDSGEIDTAYTTTDYSVTIDINENNIYKVTEDISVDFNEARHGIIRYIPTSGAYKFKKDGKNISKPFRSDIHTVYANENAYIYDSNGYLNIKLGNEYTTITGPKNYKISYTIDTKADFFEDYDLFYLNVIPQFWATPIQNSSFRINFPKTFDTSKINTYCGEFGSLSSNGFYVRVSEDGKSIIGESTRALKAYEGASVLVQLDNGYFSNQDSYAIIVPILALVSVIVAVITAILWFAFGKDDTIIPVVSFDAPDGITSAEAGFIINGTVDDKDLLSLLIYWADKGYVSLDVKDEKNLKITKLSELPVEAKSFESTIFDKIFGSKPINTTVNMNGLGYSFVESFQKAGKQLQNQFESNGSGSVYSKLSVFLQGVTSLTSYVPILSVAIFYTYKFGYESGCLLAVAVVCLIMFAVNFFAKKFVDNYYATKPAMITTSYIIFGLLNLFAGVFIIYLAYAWLYCLTAMSVALICTYISLYFSIIMKKRSKQGEQHLGELLGLRDFIFTAEKDRIEALVDDNPQYFYHILPFAYALGVSNVWAERFEGLVIYSSPYINTDMTVFNAIRFNSILNHSMSKVSYSMTQDTINHNAANSRSSGGSGGGGFSGGGFSGGGMGGGGGHSW